MWKSALSAYSFRHLASLQPTTSYIITSSRAYTAVTRKMSDLFIDLTAPNGKKWKQPIGIFINNEFVKSKTGEKITSINPTSVAVSFINW